MEVDALQLSKALQGSEQGTRSCLPARQKLAPIQVQLAQARDAAQQDGI
jgi:hypothetical protein